MCVTYYYRRTFLPARRYASAVLAMDLFVTSRCCIKTDRRIELVLACRLLSTYPILHKQTVYWILAARKAGLNKHTGKSCIHKIHNIHKIKSLEMI